MSTAQSSDSIRNRFMSEVQRISQYVSFVVSKATIKNVEIRDINKVLKVNDIGTIQTQPRAMSDKAWSVDDMKNLLATIDKLQPAVHTRIETLTSLMTYIVDPSDLYKDEVLEEFDNWVNWIDGEMPDDPTNSYLKEAPNHYFENAYRENSDGPLPPELLKEIIQEAFQVIVYNRNVENVQRLEYVHAKFDHIRVAVSLSMLEADLNILRQAFILLMTAFDAAIFDLVRQAIKNNFFALISVFGKDAKESKLTLKDMKRFESMEDFADDLIESQLKTRYLRDLLYTLDQQGLQLFDRKVGATLGKLVELVLRRNIHVHNRGRVDERYFDRDENGKPRMNIFQFKLGELAIIDRAYWQDCIAMCKFCVDAVADWVDAGAGKTARPQV